MTQIQHHKSLETTPDMPKSCARGPLHLCEMCGAHFMHLFAYNRHLLRQHWFEAQKEFSEEKLQSRVEGLTDKQSQKLRELYQKLKDRNSPTPPKRSRRSKPASDSDPYTREPRVSNLKEYKLVTVDDMSEAYKDKYNNPGGYTIFHFKVPKKSNPVVSPPLTALKKTYHTGDNKLPQRTEKVPITTSSQLSSWQQHSFQQHLSRGITHNLSQGVNSLLLAGSRAQNAVTSSSRLPMSSPSRVAMSSPSRVAMTSPSRVAMSTPVGRNAAHGSCEKCRKRNVVCDNKQCATGWAGLPLNFSSPLLSSAFNCTDILKKIISSPDDLAKPEISLTVEETKGETKVDVMSINLPPAPHLPPTNLSSLAASLTPAVSLTPSPSSSLHSSPCSSSTYETAYSETAAHTAAHSAAHYTTNRITTERMLAEESLSVLAQIGLEMVYSQLRYHGNTLP